MKKQGVSLSKGSQGNAFGPETKIFYSKREIHPIHVRRHTKQRPYDWNAFVCV